MSLPRHTLNLSSAVVCGTTLTFHVWRCQPFMQLTTGVVLASSIIYHGSHCVGRVRWAEDVFMKYDVGCTFGAALMVNILTFRSSLFLFALLSNAFAVFMWMLSFKPLKGLPQNPILSLLHAHAIYYHPPVAKSLDCSSLASQWLAGLCWAAIVCAVPCSWSYIRSSSSTPARGKET